MPNYLQKPQGAIVTAEQHSTVHLPFQNTSDGEPLFQQFLSTLSAHTGFAYREANPLTVQDLAVAHHYTYFWSISDMLSFVTENRALLHNLFSKAQLYYTSQRRSFSVELRGGFDLDVNYIPYEVRIERGPDSLLVSLDTFTPPV